MKSLSVLFTIFLFLLALALSRQLQRAGALPAEAHNHDENIVQHRSAGAADEPSTFASYPSAAEHQYN